MEPLPENEALPQEARFFLRPGERVIWSGRCAPWITFSQVLCILLGVGLIYLAARWEAYLDTYTAIALYAAGALPFYAAARERRRQRMGYYACTHYRNIAFERTFSNSYIITTAFKGWERDYKLMGGGTGSLRFRPAVQSLKRFTLLRNGHVGFAHTRDVDGALLADKEERERYSFAQTPEPFPAGATARLSKARKLAAKDLKEGEEIMFATQKHTDYIGLLRRCFYYSAFLAVILASLPVLLAGGLLFAVVLLVAILFPPVGVLIGVLGSVVLALPMTLFESIAEKLGTIGPPAMWGIPVTCVVTNKRLLVYGTRWNTLLEAHPLSSLWVEGVLIRGDKGFVDLETGHSVYGATGFRHTITLKGGAPACTGLCATSTASRPTSRPPRSTAPARGAPPPAQNPQSRVAAPPHPARQ